MDSLRERADLAGHAQQARRRRRRRPDQVCVGLDLRAEGELVELVGVHRAQEVRSVGDVHPCSVRLLQCVEARVPNVEDLAVRSLAHARLHLRSSPLADDAHHLIATPIEGVQAGPSLTAMVAAVWAVLAEMADDDSARVRRRPEAVGRPRPHGRPALGAHFV
nr:hypothetical protein [Saccharopolyspora shandongensis]